MVTVAMGNGGSSGISGDDVLPHSLLWVSLCLSPVPLHTSNYLSENSSGQSQGALHSHSSRDPAQSTCSNGGVAPPLAGGLLGTRLASLGKTLAFGVVDNGRGRFRGGHKGGGCGERRSGEEQSYPALL